MTLAEIKLMLEETGVYVGYGFVINRPPPYISYREAYSNNAFADNAVTAEAVSYTHLVGVADLVGWFLSRRLF